MLEHVQNLWELEIYLGYSEKVLTGLVPDDHYSRFEIPKPNQNAKRLIEAPRNILLEILRKLSDYQITKAIGSSFSCLQYFNHTSLPAIESGDHLGGHP